MSDSVSINMRVQVKAERLMRGEFEYFKLESIKERSLHEMLHGLDHSATGDEGAVLTSRTPFCESAPRSPQRHHQSRSHRRRRDRPEGRVRGSTIREGAPGGGGEARDILEHEFGHRMIRALLKFCALFTQTDLFALSSRRGRGMCEDERVEWVLPGELLRLRLPALKGPERSRWFCENRAHLWPRVVRLVWLMTFGHLCGYLFHQYIYDYYKFRLNRVRWLNATHPHEALARHLEREDFLLEQMAKQESRFQTIGGPHHHLAFVCECIYLLALLVTFISYALPQLYFGLLQPFNFYTLRNFLDYQSELKQNRRLVSDQARLFVESSRCFTRAMIEFSKQSIGKRLLTERHYGSLTKTGDHAAPSGQGPKSGPAPSAKAPSTSEPEASEIHTQSILISDQLDRLARSESLSCKQLRQMLRNNDLQPMNQAEGWVRVQARHYAYFWIFCLSYTVFLDYSFAAPLLAAIRPDFRFMSADSVIMVELLFLMLVCNVTALYFTMACLPTCVDQLQLANKLRRLIAHVTCLNNLRFHKNLLLKKRAHHLQQVCRQSVASLSDGLADCGGGGEELAAWAEARRAELRNELARSERQLLAFDSTYENKMNNDILLVLMHYKIFVAQLMQHKRALQAIAFISVVVMFIAPILNRLHMSYFERNMDKRLLLHIVTVSTFVLVPVDCNLLPVCTLHKRCMKLYDQLNNLLAHATEVINCPEGRDIYDRHIVSILRKEMCHPDRMVRQFAIQINGLTFTYPNLIRLHFYFGFVILSILVENQNLSAGQQEVVGTLFSDPLGIF